MKIKNIIIIFLLIGALGLFTQPVFSALVGKDQKVIIVNPSDIKPKGNNGLSVQLGSTKKDYKVSSKIIKNIKNITICKGKLRLIINETEIKNIECLEKKKSSF